MLLPLPQYTVTDLRVDINSASQRIYLNERGTVVGRGMVLPAKGEPPEQVFLINGRRRLLFPEDVTGVGGLNDRDEVALETKQGSETWQAGRFHRMPAKPSDQGLLPGWGLPIGIDDSGTVLFLASGVEGSYAVHRWPKPAEETWDWPLPTAVAEDGTYCGVRGLGGMLPGPFKGPTGFFFDGKVAVPIGGEKDFTSPGCISRNHWIGGSGSHEGLNQGKPFIWHGGTLTWLPVPVGGQSRAVVNGINSDGIAVGAANYEVVKPNEYINVNHAELWRDGTLTDLNDLLPASCPWELTSAEAINDRGQIVARAVPKGPAEWPPTLVLLTPHA